MFFTLQGSVDPVFSYATNLPFQLNISNSPIVIDTTGLGDIT